MKHILKDFMNFSVINSILILLTFFIPAQTWAEADIHSKHKAMMNNEAKNTEVDPHAHHKAMMKNTKSFKSSSQKYHIPKLTLLDKMGIKTPTSELFKKDKAQMVNFIFTTCNTICPVLSGTFSQLDKSIAKLDQDVELISITIDPEYDTPKVLKDYGKKFNSSEKWKFFTGSRKDIISIQTAFDAYRGSKMNHEPITLLRTANKEKWTRIEGFATAKELMIAMEE